MNVRVIVMVMVAAVMLLAACAEQRREDTSNAVLWRSRGDLHPPAAMAGADHATRIALSFRVVTGDLGQMRVLHLIDEETIAAGFRIADAPELEAALGASALSVSAAWTLDVASDQRASIVNQVNRIAFVADCRVIDAGGRQQLEEQRQEFVAGDWFEARVAAQGEACSMQDVRALSTRLAATDTCSGEVVVNGTAQECHWQELTVDEGVARLLAVSNGIALRENQVLVLPMYYCVNHTKPTVRASIQGKIDQSHQVAERRPPQRVVLFTARVVAAADRRDDGERRYLPRP